MTSTTSTTSIPPQDQPRVIFAGAGPGDPELLPLKTHRLIAEAQAILFAGSLVNPAVFAHCPPTADVADSAAMDLETLCDWMITRVKAGKTVLRLHTGDPSLYGAIAEQIRRLKAAGVPYEVIPGISSFLAGAALLGTELTLPGFTQTVILTRMSGRTPVPEKEALEKLAAHRATLVLFLSTGMVEKVAEACLTAYPPETPAALVYRAGWPDQQVIRGTLATLPEQVKEAGINRTALIYIGDCLQGQGEDSLLYHAAFSHGYREGHQ
ncbi:precorrin-4 C(11)-methyltransferase [Anoxynatronum sibiricum]|uniref:Precorrin-4 C(11)-methyltransferase n=1 Tax=Anoxynatronum sibiricum TaxID=210623 RepID=A0ABU9VSU5_9CLOT